MPPVPNATVTKNPFALPALPPSSDGILAIIASAAGGTQNQPAVWANPNLMVSTYTAGPLPEYGAYDQNVSGRPVVGMRSNPSVAATYGSITKTGTGTFTVASTSATFPYEHYDVIINFISGGTLGTAGITYTYSLDGGNSVSKVQSLGTGLIIAIPNSGVSFTLSTTGTSTVVAGDGITCFTERALMSDSDVTTSLGILALTRLPWEGVLLDQNFGTSSVGIVDGILSGLEAGGQFHFAISNTRFKNEPQPTTESEAAYATALTTLMGSQTSERMCVGADGGHVPSTLTGLNLKRPTAMALAAMAMSLTPNIGIDPAFVGNGPVQGYAVTDSNSNPLDHDEALYPDLDNLGYTTLRSFAPGGPAGIYICNANVISPSNSNIKYLQQLRVMNKACTIAWQILAGQLSLGVSSQLNTTTNQLNIKESDAQKIDQLVTPALQGALKGQVSTVNGVPGAQFTTNRDDNLSASPAVVGGTVSLVSLIYIKGFAVVVAFTKTITAPA